MVKSCTKFSEVKTAITVGRSQWIIIFLFPHSIGGIQLPQSQNTHSYKLAKTLYFSSKEIGAAPIQTSKPSLTQDTLDLESTEGPNGISTPLPYNPHRVTNCALFYKVNDGDNCVTLGSKNGLSLNNICKWSLEATASQGKYL
jgi:hypothetical protein